MHKCTDNPPHEKGYILSRGTKIHYRSYGTGETLLMLHGNMQNASYFRKQIAFFKSRYRVIAIDTRGHGESEFGPQRLSLDIFAEDIMTVMETLHIDKTIVLGFSDGGNVALKLAGLIPDKLVAIIAVGSNLSPEGLKKWVKVPLVMFYKFSVSMDAFKWFRKRAQLLSLMIHEPNMTSEQLKQVLVPTLILSGEQDLVQLKHSEMIAASLPHSELAIIKNSGHFLLKTHSAPANKVILDFLKRVEKKMLQ